MSKQHPNQEDDYFAQLDREKRDALRKKLQAAEFEKAEAELKSVHFNHCDKCGHELAPRLFKGVEIDVCTSCGSVLLDPGELQELAGEETGVFKNLAEMFGMAKDR